MTYTTDDWRGLYRASWKGEISAEAMRHPAKFARALAMRIYDHAVEEGWLNSGGTVIVTQEIRDGIVAELEVDGIPYL